MPARELPDLPDESSLRDEELCPLGAALLASSDRCRVLGVALAYELVDALVLPDADRDEVRDRDREHERKDELPVDRVQESSAEPAEEALVAMPHGSPPDVVMTVARIARNNAPRMSR